MLHCCRGGSFSPTNSFRCPSIHLLGWSGWPVACRSGQPVILPFYFFLLLLSNSKSRHGTAYRRGSTTGPLLLMMDGENCWKVPNKKKRDSNCWVLLFCEICQIHRETEATWNESQIKINVELRIWRLIRTSDIPAARYYPVLVEL